MVVVIKRKPEPTLEHEGKGAIFLKKGKNGQNKIKKQVTYGYSHTKVGYFFTLFEKSTHLGATISPEKGLE